MKEETTQKQLLVACPQRTGGERRLEVLALRDDARAATTGLEKGGSKVQWAFTQRSCLLAI